MNYSTCYQYKQLKNIDMHLYGNKKQKSNELARDLFDLNLYIYDEKIVQQIKDINALLEQLDSKQKETFERIDEIRTEFAKNNEEIHAADLEN